MQLIRQGGIGKNGPNTALALGYFDGIHKGHVQVIGAAVEYAKTHGLQAAVFTFSEPEGKGNALLTAEQKYGVLEEMGVDYCFEPSFPSVKNLPPRRFFTRNILHDYRAKAIFCGENFGFGAHREGNTEMLKRFCEEQGMDISVLPLAQWRGFPVSSSRIRTAIASGEIGEANAMLGRPYTILLPIQKGKGIGRAYGFPTINQVFPADMQQPKYGVYISRALVGGAWRPSATGYGTRPTVDGVGATCETFIPNFEGNLYGEKVAVRFYKRIADIQKFASAKQLAAAVQTWAKQAADYFEAEADQA